MHLEGSGLGCFPVVYSSGELYFLTFGHVYLKVRRNPGFLN